MSVQDHEFEIRELHAREECETLSVIGRTGKPDHGFNAELKKCFAHFKGSGAINWQQTLELRKKLVAGYEKAKEKNG
jgi:hypothetical protein